MERRAGPITDPHCGEGSAILCSWTGSRMHPTTWSLCWRIHIGGSRRTSGFSRVSVSRYQRWFAASPRRVRLCGCSAAVCSTTRLTQTRSGSSCHCSPIAILASVCTPMPWPATDARTRAVARAPRGFFPPPCACSNEIPTGMFERWRAKWSVDRCTRRTSQELDSAQPVTETLSIRPQEGRGWYARGGTMTEKTSRTGVRGRR